MIMITMRMILQWLCLKIHWNNYQVQGSPSLRLGGKNWLLLSREASSPNLQPTAHSCPSLIILIRWYNKDADKTMMMLIYDLIWWRQCWCLTWGGGGLELGELLGSSSCHTFYHIRHQHRIVTGNLDANLIYLLGPPTNWLNNLV